MKLLIKAITKFIFGLVFVGMLLFLPAGTFAFANAWVFIALFFAVPSCNCINYTTAQKCAIL